ALLTLAIWQFAVAGRHRPPDAPAAAPGSRTPLVLAGALVMYAAAFPGLGFLVTSVALVFVAARLMGLGGWWRPAALALGVTLAARVVFVSWLGVPLP
ncbi:MAG TPA: tripartite tricarboxylate transporter TctB family protein, partial [Methylomirabilota bacterium]|nr:tripartite tricarboxylate transporter TctB family protein [Methylomirabilota bacterium]